MTGMRNLRVVCLWTVAAASIPVLCFAQRLHVLEEGKSHFEAPGGPLSARVVDAPFSADATTVVKMTTLEGRIPLERTATARYYRDRAGRVRVEQMPATGSTQAPAATPIWITLDSPDTPGEIGLDPATRAARFMPRLHGEAVGGGHTFGVPLGPGGDGEMRFLVIDRPLHYRETLESYVQEEPLGNREIEGIATVGSRTTFTLPGGVVQVIDERWESPELKLLVYSRVSDPRCGAIEYRLTNIRRDAPPAELFVVPAGYEFNARIMPIRYEFWGNDPWR